MPAISSRIKNGCTNLEEYLLKVKNVIYDSVYAIKARFSPLPVAHADDASNGSSSAENNLCSTCSYHAGGHRICRTCMPCVCCGTCQACTGGLHSAFDFTGKIVSGALNFFCYPFLPCLLVLLPSGCRDAVHPDNSTSCCYGGTTCLHMQSTEKQTCGKVCCSQQCCAIWISVVVIILFLSLWGLMQDSTFIIQLLLFLDDLPPMILLLIFILLFTIVSFPMAWGYVILNLAAGYLYGFVPSIPVVIISVTIGITVAHILCKHYFSNWLLGVLKNRSNFNQMEAIIHVIDSASGLKVIALTRLTPIPFGFQNGLFAISNVNLKKYLLYSNFGLFPTQVLNCYLGSTVRSMQEIILNDSSSLLLLFQIAVGICLMTFVLRRARKELAAALQASEDHVDGSNEQALIGAQTAQVSLSEVKCTQPLSNVEPATGIQ